MPGSVWRSSRATTISVSLTHSLYNINEAPTVASEDENDTNAEAPKDEASKKEPSKPEDNKFVMLRCGLPVPGSSAQSSFRGLWNTNKLGRRGFRQLWTALKNQRNVKKGLMTQEEYNRWKDIPNPVTLKKLGVDTLKYGFPVDRKDIRCKFSNWMKLPSATTFLLRIYTEMHKSVNKSRTKKKTQNPIYPKNSLGPSAALSEIFI